MPVVAPNTPKTTWIRDNGTVVSPPNDVLVDEDGNYFVDEDGRYLLDSVSTDGTAPNTAWIGEITPNTQWASAWPPLTAVEIRVTVATQTRVTEEGQIRVAKVADNEKPMTHWSEDEY